MATEAQVTANRLNAQKSTGPRTPEGKAAVAQNAIRHGLCARRDVIEGEDREEFERHRRELLDELRPAGKVESILTGRIVSLSWRLQRAERLENEAFDCLLAWLSGTSVRDMVHAMLPEALKPEYEDPAINKGLELGRMAVSDFSQQRVLAQLQVYEQRIERSLFKTMRELDYRRLKGSMGAGDGIALVREAMGDSAKQSQSAAGEGTPCGVTTSASNSVKQSQSAAGEETPCGVTTNAGDSAKQSQSGMVEGGQSGACGSVEQSQNPKPAVPFRFVPSARPRVAWHTHGPRRSQ